MWICPNCHEIYSDEFIDDWDHQENNHVFYWKNPDDYEPCVCPDCGEVLDEAHLCEVCGENWVEPDAMTCPECDKYTRYAQTVYQKCEELFYALIKVYAGRNEKALTYMRDLYEEGLL